MPLTAPNSEQTIGKLNELWISARRYYDQSDWRLRQVAKLGAQLLRSDTAAGWSVLAGVSALSGDEVSARENADKAVRISSQPGTIFTKASILGNLGYFSQAGQVFRQVLSVDVLPAPLIGERAIASGSVLALDEVIKKAGNMPTAVSDHLQKTVCVAAEILRRNDVSDEDVGVWLDKAGEIMRERRLFFMADALLFATTEEDFGQVDLSFVIDVNSEQAAELNQELVERCVRAEVVPPECFSFGFRSNPELNERIAA